MVPATVLAISLLVLIRLIFYGFINWDDDIYVYENQSIINSNFKSLVADPVAGNYNPLPMVTFAVEWAIAGNSPWLFHLDNLILHLICTLLVYRLARRMGLREMFAAFVALAFSIHPMHLESVAWVTERKDVLMGVFYLASLLSYMRYSNGDGRKWIFWSLFWFVLALLSKIQAVSLPLSLILIDWLQHRRLTGKLLLQKLPFLLGSLAIGSLGVMILQGQGYLEVTGKFSILDRLVLAGNSLWQYLWKSIAGGPLSLLHPYPAEVRWRHWLGFIGVIGFVAFLILGRKRWPHWAFGGAFFLVNIVFVLQFVGAGNAYMADRFSYLPYIGLFLALGMKAQIWSEGGALKWIPIVGLAGLSLWFIVRTSLYLPAWKDSNSIWNHTIALYPGRLPLAYVNRGNDLRLRQAEDHGLADFNTAIAIAPSLDLGYLNRGDLYLSQGIPGAALQDYDQVIRLRGPIPEAPPANPNLIQALANRGAAYGQLGQFDLALGDLNQALKLLPAQPAFLMNRAQVFISTQRWADALQDLNEVIRQQPQHAAAYLNRSFANANLGNLPAARNDAQQAQSLGLAVDQGYMRQLGL